MTARDLSAAQLAAIAAGNVVPAIFFEGEFTNAGSPYFLRLWTGPTTYPWNGHDWTGAGHVLSFSALEESIETKSVNFSVSISGQPQANIALALEATRRNAPGKLWLGFINPADMSLLDTPYLVRKGRFSTIPIDDGGDTATIGVTYEDQMAGLQKSRERRYTSGSQQLRDPADVGFSWVESLQNAIFDFNKH